MIQENSINVLTGQPVLAQSVAPKEATKATEVKQESQTPVPTSGDSVAKGTPTETQGKNLHLYA